MVNGGVNEVVGADGVIGAYEVSVVVVEFSVVRAIAADVRYLVLALDSVAVVAAEVAVMAEVLATVASAVMLAVLVTVASAVASAELVVSLVWTVVVG